MYMNRALIRSAFLLAICVLSQMTIAQTAFSVKEEDSIIRVKAKNYQLEIRKNGFRYSILKTDGSVLLDAHEQSGITYLGVPVVQSKLIGQDEHTLRFETINTLQVKGIVTITPSDRYCKMEIRIGDQRFSASITARTKGLSPVYGLSDHAAVREHPSTEVSGYESNYFGALADGRHTRLVSNFVISPQKGIACVHLEPGKKRLRFSAREWMQGSDNANAMPALFYFTGTPQEIYQDYLTVRNFEKYPVYAPKYEWFGVGWEAFGALGWITNHQTISENINTYLQKGFPLSWMVIGSGFWPNHEARFQATTSFGLWDTVKYPDPSGLIHSFHDKGLKVILGLRIAFIPTGPYTEEGIAKGYFIKKEGKARIFRVSFPKSDCYFLDGNNPQAVKWYLGLCKKWLSYGVDGFKEDLFGYEITDFPDSKLNAVNEALMNDGVYVMGRNGYISSPMDLHRYEDFNYNQNQDRGPVNGLSFAYSGFPYVYPDIVGGTGLANNLFGDIDKEKLKIYLMRNARYASVNPSMSFGYGVWELNDPRVLQVCLEAARLHARLHPYIYSEAIHTYATGFPYTLTPLPLAFPSDTRVHNRENDKVRGYQWMIGDALMAAPLYGNDYDTATHRTIYLPAGSWMDYDNGRLYKGPLLLDKFYMPVEKTPLFVGGSGFVPEEVNGKLMGRIYPVGFAGTTSFRDNKAGVGSTIRFLNGQWKEPIVKDLTTGKTIRTKLVRHAFEFEFIPGHNYEIR